MSSIFLYFLTIPLFLLYNKLLCKIHHMGIIGWSEGKMTIGALIVLALVLSMDAFAVSVSNSLYCAGLTKRQAVQASGAYGLFQGLMPVLGCLAGTLFAAVVQQWDHWLAFILLVCIGGKMLIDAIRAMRSNEPERCPAS